MSLDELMPVDRVAEGLWQTINQIEGVGIEAHEAWLELPEAEKENWRAEATTAITDLKRRMNLT